MEKRTGAPTLNDVAKQAGVSTATVSRCLNSPDQVSERTRQRVLQTVEALGYTPNFGARVMAANQSYTIGAIVPTMENAIFARGLQAFQNHLRENGYTLLVSSSAYDQDAESEQIRTLVGRGADGLLLIGHERDRSIYDYLERNRVPTLVAWSYSKRAERPCIGFDNFAAMYELTQNVLQTGHRRIAMISGITQGNDRASSRVAGVRLAMEHHGLNPSSLRMVEAPYDIEKAARAFQQLMAQTPQSTVVICGNDVLAAGALKRAQAMGLRVPQDVSITGFDDLELANIVTPRLTTIRVPDRQMGLQAAQEIIEMVEGKSSGRRICIDAKLIMRQSLAPIEE